MPLGGEGPENEARWERMRLGKSEGGEGDGVNLDMHTVLYSSVPQRFYGRTYDQCQVRSHTVCKHCLT